MIERSTTLNQVQTRGRHSPESDSCVYNALEITEMIAAKRIEANAPASSNMVITQKKTTEAKNIKPGDWACLKCEFINFRFRIDCLECGTGRETCFQEAANNYTPNSASLNSATMLMNQTSIDTTTTTSQIQNTSKDTISSNNPWPQNSYFDVLALANKKLAECDKVALTLTPSNTPMYQNLNPLSTQTGFPSLPSSSSSKQSKNNNNNNNNNSNSRKKSLTSYAKAAKDKLMPENDVADGGGRVAQTPLHRGQISVTAPAVMIPDDEWSSANTASVDVPTANPPFKKRGASGGESAHYEQWSSSSEISQGVDAGGHTKAASTKILESIIHPKKRESGMTRKQKTNKTAARSSGSDSVTSWSSAAPSTAFSYSTSSVSENSSTISSSSFSSSSANQSAKHKSKNKYPKETSKITKQWPTENANFTILKRPDLLPPAPSISSSSSSPAQQPLFVDTLSDSVSMMKITNDGDETTPTESKNNPINRIHSMKKSLDVNNSLLQEKDKAVIEWGMMTCDDDEQPETVLFEEEELYDDEVDDDNEEPAMEIHENMYSADYAFDNEDDLEVSCGVKKQPKPHRLKKTDLEIGFDEVSADAAAAAADATSTLFLEMERELMAINDDDEDDGRREIVVQELVPGTAWETKTILPTFTVAAVELEEDEWGQAPPAIDVAPVPSFVSKKVWI
ncbi:hypothetical protein BDR26DRAFT_855752 [Obelidium mucronatum]|nr:hypothetical protein BDR26DRAFT_855752 [Obelidium mucronatum]